MSARLARERYTPLHNLVRCFFMAENKKSFILYCDLIHTVEQMPDDKAGLLFKHILRYVNDKNPITDDLIIKLTFEPVKQQLKRDLQKYYSICDRNKENGKKGGRPVKQEYTENPEEPKKPTGLFGNPEEPKKPDSDTDSDTDSGTDTVIEKKKRKKVEIYDDVKSSYKKCIDIYNSFVLKQTTVKPIFNGKQGVAMKKLINYFYDNTKDKPPTEQSIFNGFNYVLNNYDKWGKYHQGNFDLCYIHSKIVDIINAILVNSKTTNKN